MNSIEINNLSLNFGDVKVLKDLNLSVNKGEFLVLLGASGCGKSTLLNCVAGLENVDFGGKILINKKEVTHLAPKDRNISMVFQSYALYPTMNVRQNITFGMKCRGVPRPEMEETLKITADLLQIGDLLDRKPASLSGGQRQRISIARALYKKADVLIFDEATSALDSATEQSVMKAIEGLGEKLTILIIAHRLTTLKECDRIIKFDKDNVFHVGSYQDMLSTSND